MPHCQLLPALERFSTAKILVIGDAILDHYVVGKVERISPEAPVPILHAQDEFDRAGGAANVAANVTSLGANATLIALAGKSPATVAIDSIGLRLVEQCRIRGITAEFIPALANTIQKTRLLAGQQQMLRVDWETPVELDPVMAAARAAKIAAALANADLILISDYAKGMLDAALMEQLRAAGKKIIIDPRPQNTAFYHGATLITPNRKEAIAMLATHEKMSDEELGRRLSEKLAADILLTLSEAGMCLCERGKPPLKISTRAREVYDVTGAGDTVVATFAVATAIGCTAVQAAELANHAAGVVVGHVGAAAITVPELRVSLEGAD